MKNWHLTLQLPADSNAPVYRRIVATIIGDVERGRIRPGEQLPSSRALAVQLGVHRNTVLAAYDDLAAQGVIRGSPAKGMFVVDPHAPDVESFDLEPNGSRPRTAGFDLGDDVVTEMNFASPCRYVLLGGVPDLRFLPLTELSRAYRAALRSATKKRSLSYGDPLGDEQLRRALGELLTRVRGVSVGPESICVVRGAQAGLYLAARALVRPGDVVALEAYRFPWASEALRLAGASLYPVPVDQDGLDVTVLEALAERTRVRAVYLTPHHQCPTTVALSPDRRRRLLALARRTRMIVLEDDYDFDFHYEGRPRLPLASADRAGVVIYVGTMSKTLAPGLRLGYVVATPDVVKRIEALRFYVARLRHSSRRASCKGMSAARRACIAVVATHCARRSLEGFRRWNSVRPPGVWPFGRAFAGWTSRAGSGDPARPAWPFRQGECSAPTAARTMVYESVSARAMKSRSTRRSSAWPRRSPAALRATTGLDRSTRVARQSAD